MYARGKIRERADRREERGGWETRHVTRNRKIHRYICLEFSLQMYIISEEIQTLSNVSLDVIPSSYFILIKFTIPSHFLLVLSRFKFILIIKLCQ